MIIRKTTIEAVETAAQAVGVAVEFTVLGNSRGGGQSISVRVIPGEDREKYRRISYNGRRIHAVCWHGFRDFFRALFAITPGAVAKTALATYDGAEGFERTYSGTAYQNIGSMVQPMHLKDACLCVDAGEDI